MSLYHVVHPKPEYPKMKFAPTGGAVMVQNATEERALGHGWTDTAPDDPAPADSADEKPAKRGKK